MDPTCGEAQSIPTVEKVKTFYLGSRHYLARPTKFKRYRNKAHEDVGDDFEPLTATCLRTEAKYMVDADSLRAWRSAYLDKDDVFHPGFLREIIFISDDRVRLTRDTQGVFENWGTIKFSFQPQLDLPTGPCYVENDVVHSVWRVYEDRQLAFLQAVWPSLENESVYTQINAAGNGYRGLGIAVPARPFTQGIKLLASRNKDPSDRPLAGMRILVKDNFHLRGIRISLGNRAYYESNSIPDFTAAALSRLLDAGAHIIGKAHQSAFAMMEHPMQSVDYQAPFNPRGDGYMIAGGSSGGNAAAVAAYDWVDLSMCSDTVGSARIPAFQNGVFGFRPSTHSIDSHGMVDAWKAMDTPGLLARDLATFPRVLRVLQSNNLLKPFLENRSSFQILYPTDFIPQDCPEQVDAMENFINDINETGAPQPVKISIREDWRETAPVEEKDLHEYMKHSMVHGWYYSAYQSFEEFRQQYSRVHNRPPFVTEIVRWYWRLGSQVTAQQHAELMDRFSTFKTWFLKQYQLDGSSNKLVAIHIDQVKPRYRDDYPGNKNPEIQGLRPTFLSAILGAPEIAIPITQISYQSRITQREEKLPVVISLMGPPGTDVPFLEWLLASLRRSGRPSKVKTGNVAFDN